MATNDVPGANPANNDKLSRGCWAEHTDGSMIFIKDIDENDRVIFEMYDLTNKDDPVFYPQALAKLNFEKQFSYKQGSKDLIRWTWHDKTPMPWEKVMKIIQSPMPVRSAEATISAAKKVAESLRARGQLLDEDHVSNLANGITNKVRLAKAAEKMFEGFKDLIQGLGE